MTGCTHKLLLLFIGKSEKPHKFYLFQNPDFSYYYNPTAWMNESIFNDFIGKLNIEMIIKKKSIVLFLDNCTAHPINISTSNVKVIFLPANTTSVLQPIIKLSNYQITVIIKCFKGYYHVKMARYLIK